MYTTIVFLHEISTDFSGMISHIDCAMIVYPYICAQHNNSQTVYVRERSHNIYFDFNTNIYSVISHIQDYFLHKQ